MTAQGTWIAESVRELDEETWDQLVGSEVFATYGWLKTVEETAVHKTIPRYFLARHKGRLAGVAVCFYFAKRGDSQDVNEIIFGRFKHHAGRIGISFQPVLVCCPFSTSGAHIFVQEGLGPADRGEVVRSLVEAIEKEARRLKAAMAFPNVLEHERDLISALQDKGYAVTLSSPYSLIETHWGSFDEYLSWLGGISRSMPRKIRQEMKRNQKAGVTYRRLEDPGGHSRRIFELLDANSRQHQRGCFAFTPDFLKKIKENMRENAVITVAEKAGQIIGAIVAFKRGGVMRCAFIGVDHEMAGKDCTYFNLLYYRMFELAMADKARLLHFGPMLYESKARRGCKVIMPLFFYKPLRRFNQGPVKAWFRFHAAWYRRKLLRDLEPVHHYPGVALLPHLRKIRQGSWGVAAEKEIPAQILSV